MEKLKDLRYEFEIFERQHKSNNFKTVWMVRKKKYFFLFLIFTMVTFLIGGIVVLTWIVEYDLVPKLYRDALNDLNDIDWQVFKGSRHFLNPDNKALLINTEIPHLFSMLLPIILLVLAFACIVPVGTTVIYIQTSNLPQNSEQRKKILVNSLLLNTLMMLVVGISVIAIKDVFINFLFKTQISHDLPLFVAMSNFLNNFIWAIWMFSFFYLFTLAFCSECRFKFVLSMQLLYVLLMTIYYFVGENVENNPDVINNILYSLRGLFGVPFVILAAINVVFVCFTFFCHTTSIRLHIKVSYINIKLMQYILFYGTISFLVMLCASVSHFISMQTVNSLVRRLSIRENLIIFSNDPTFNPGKYWDPSRVDSVFDNAKILSFFYSTERISAQGSICEAVYVIATFMSSLYILVALKYRVDGIYKQAKVGFIYSYLTTIGVIVLGFSIIATLKKFKGPDFGYGISYTTLIFMMLILIFNLTNFTLCNSISLIEYKSSILYVLFVITIGDLSILQVVEQLIAVKFDNTDKIIDINYFAQFVAQVFISFVVGVSCFSLFRKSMNSSIYFEGDQFDMIDESLFEYSDLVYKYNFKKDHILNHQIKNTNEDYLFQLEYLRVKTEIKYILKTINALKKENNHVSEILIKNKSLELDLYIALAYYLKIKHKALVKIKQRDRFKETDFYKEIDKLFKIGETKGMVDLINKKIINRYVKKLSKNQLLSNVSDFEKEVPINMVIDFHNKP